MIFDKIQKLCDKKKISIRTLEMMAGLGNGTIGRWRKSDPGVNNLYAVAKILEVPIEYFLEGE